MAPNLTRVALLRAINLAGRNRIAMADLRALMLALGLQDPRTMLQSGNAVFQSPSPTAALEQQLESEVVRRFSLNIDFVVRTSPEWAAAIGANPFPAEAKADPSHLLVMFLKAAPGDASVKGLQAAIRGREVVRAEGRQLYMVYPDGIGRSKLTTAIVEKALGTRGTARNWNTVIKLAALAGV